jgi:DNA-binding NarL/FixJ family response regulator
MLRFLHVDEHEICRIGFRAILSEISSSISLDEANNGESALSLFKTYLHDCVIIEINLPNTNVYELVQHFIRLNTNCKVMVLSSVSERLYAINYIKIGVKGFVGKHEPAKVLKDALVSIINNKRFFSDIVFDILLNQTFRPNQTNLIGDSSAKSDKITLPFEKLTARELEILRMLTQGYGTKEIANMQNLRLNTISTYKMRIFDKLNVNNLVELVQLIKEQGLYDGTMPNSVSLQSNS